MLEPWLAVAGGLAVLVAASSKLLDRLPISEPLLALVVGVLVGPDLLGLLELPEGRETELVATATQLLLAISLTGIALRYPIRELRGRLPAITALLLVVMPAMAAISGALAFWTTGLPIAAAAALGAALSPTDPVLASSVVSGPPAERTIPAHLRQSLSIESGANDGLALPLVLLTATAATSGSVVGELPVVLWEVLGGVLIGVPVGWVAARALQRAEAHGDTDRSRSVAFTLILALVTLGVASVAATDGLLAVFTAGLAFNLATSDDERRDEDTLDEAINRFLLLPVFILFGAVLPWGGWAALGWGGALLVVGVLVLRRLPVILALRRVLTRDLPGAVWLGWFGPIGVAALYYLTELEHLGVLDPRVWEAGTLVVAASTVAHGVTSAPALRWYAAAQQRRRPEAVDAPG